MCDSTLFCFIADINSVLYVSYASLCCFFVYNYNTWRMLLNLFLGWWNSWLTGVYFWNVDYDNVCLVFGRPFVRRFALCYRTVVYPVLSCPVCLSMTLMYCGQMVGWIKMPLCTDVGHSAGDIVLDGHPAPPPKQGHSSPLTFGPCLLWPTDWMDQDASWYRGKPRPMPHCVRCEWEPMSLAPQK